MSSQPKRMKQTDIRTSPSRVDNSTNQTARAPEAEDASQASVTAQERMDKVPKKEVSNEVSKDKQQDKKEKSFKYRYNSAIYSVHGDPSMTVLDALNTSHVFKKEREKAKNKDKQVLILTSKQQMPTAAAVKTDFPCCLIDSDEIIDVDFIKKDRSASMKQNKNPPPPSNPDMFVIFYIKKKGGDKIQLLLKSEALRKRVEYVCVYAHKEDTLKIALKRDGRFKKIMFEKHCALYESGTESSHELSQPVKHLDQKIFNVIVLSNTKQPDSQEDLTLSVKTEPDVASDADVADDADTRQTAVNTEQETKQKSVKSISPSSRWIAPEKIPDSGEILKLLRGQFTGLLQQLKQRENLRDNAQVKKFFREEYDKSVESFSEVKKVREIMRLCDSVCQIRRQKTAKGTGFLLFDRFILTNAHVIEKCIASDITAVFGYEDLDSNGVKHLPIKDITCFFYGKDDKDNHLDFALLEFNSDDVMAKYPQLLDHYRQDTPDNRSEICVVGHPEGQVKKMDPCFVIGGDNRSEASDEHVSKNVSFYQVMRQESLKEKWDFHKNQITYDSCFFHGSSGSPVFDADCKLIGIHTGGYVYHENKTKSIMEYAYAMKPILDYIMAKCRVKGRQDIIKILEDKIRSEASSTANQQNLTDVEMESVEDSFE